MSCWYPTGRSERHFEAGRQLKPARHLCHLGRDMGLNLLFGVGERGQDQVFENLDLARVQQALVEPDLLHVALAVKRDGDHPGPGAARHLGLVELGLHLGHALLHLLRLLHHVAKILHPSSPSSSGS